MMLKILQLFWVVRWWPLGYGEGHLVALGLGEMGPDRLGHEEEGLEKTAEFAGELVGRVGELLRQGQRSGVAGAEGPVDVEAIVVPEPDPADPRLGVLVDEGAREGEGPFEEVGREVDLVPSRHPREGAESVIGIAYFEDVLHRFALLAPWIGRGWLLSHTGARVAFACRRPCECSKVQPESGKAACPLQSLFRGIGFRAGVRYRTH